MEEFVARENIRRFQAQLDACTDPEQRETLMQLLEAERKHLSEAKSKKRLQAHKPARS
jgi:rubrerythrin